MRKLIVAMCTRSKYDLNQVAPIKLYKAGAWPIIRKRDTPEIDVYVISAKYGLINAKTSIIDNYEQLMSEERAIEIREEYKQTWLRLFDEYDEIVLNLGGEYKLTVPEWFNRKGVYHLKGSFLVHFGCIKRFYLGEAVFK